MLLWNSPLISCCSEHINHHYFRVKAWWLQHLNHLHICLCPPVPSWSCHLTDTAILTTCWYCVWKMEEAQAETLPHKEFFFSFWQSAVQGRLPEPAVARLDRELFLSILSPAVASPSLPEALTKSLGCPPEFSLLERPWMTTLKPQQLLSLSPSPCRQWWLIGKCNNAGSPELAPLPAALALCPSGISHR